MRVVAATVLVLTLTVAAWWAVYSGAHYSRTPPAPLDGAWTIIALPDTQHMVEQVPEALSAQVSWILEQARTYNIVYVTHLGDVVQRADDTAQWERAWGSLSRLSATIAWSVLPGNHDIDGAGTLRPFVQRFGALGGGVVAGAEDRRPDSGASFRELVDGTERLLMLQLPFCPSDDVLAWGRGVLEAHAQVPALVSTHGYLDRGARSGPAMCDAWPVNDDANGGEQIWRELIEPHDNVFGVLGGHYDGMSHLVSQRGGRPPVLQATLNPSPGTEGWLLMLQWQAHRRRVVVHTHSPYLGLFDNSAEGTYEFAY